MELRAVQNGNASSLWLQNFSKCVRLLDLQAADCRSSSATRDWMPWARGLCFFFTLHHYHSYFDTYISHLATCYIEQWTEQPHPKCHFFLLVQKQYLWLVPTPHRWLGVWWWTGPAPSEFSWSGHSAGVTDSLGEVHEQRKRTNKIYYHNLV